MGKRVVTETHQWVGASTVTLDPNQARYAQWRGYVDIPIAERVAVLEVYCGECRRPYEDVSGDPCSAAASNEHLRGGPIGTRAKRKHPFHDCTAAACEFADLHAV